MNLLFICTHNRCRSILAEAISNHYGQGLIKAKSAGSQAEGKVHPLTLHYLTQAGIDTNGLSSDSWDEHTNFHPDAVITVCDSAANETCPVFLNPALKIHWGLADPSKQAGDSQASEQAFLNTIETLKHRTVLLREGLKQQPSSEEQLALLQQLATAYPA